MLYEYNIIQQILVFMLVIKLKNTFFNNGPLGFFLTTSWCCVK